MAALERDTSLDAKVTVANVPQEPTPPIVNGPPNTSTLETATTPPVETTTPDKPAWMP